MIQLNHVKFGYSDTEVLEEINLTIHEGEYVVLTGENGSGKSTLMRLILGEMKPDEGEIILMNNDPRLKKRIGYVSQNGISKNQSFPATVEEIMITGLYQELGLFHLPHKKHKNKIKETLRDFGME
jgi:zinc transport system ATP-binding protein